ncbi:sorting nexin 1, partial [Tribonema minus]
ISVVDPVKQDQGGLNPYITYKINTTTDRPDFQYGQFSVIRRFKDFVWLSERLGEEFPGVINPPLPDKETLKRFDPEHIERRRVELEHYLGRVAAHGELSGAPVFMAFLQADDAAMADKKEEAKVARKEDKGGPGAELKRHWGWAVTMVKSQMGLDQAAEGKSEADLKFDAIGAYVNELDTQVQVVARHASALVKKQEGLGTTAYDLGFALTQLGNAERDTPPLGQVLQSAGEKADAASIWLKGKAQKEAEVFEAPINEYVKIIAAVKAALGKRHEKKIAYLMAAGEVENRAVAHAKLEGIAGKEEKLAAAEEALAAARAELDAAKDDFEQVTARVLREFDRFRREKAADMQKMLKAFVTTQIEYNRHVEECWQGLLPAIENMEEVR